MVRHRFVSREGAWDHPGAACPSLEHALALTLATDTVCLDELEERDILVPEVFGVRVVPDSVSVVNTINSDPSGPVSVWSQ